jgi:hypothetical protein
MTSSELSHPGVQSANLQTSSRGRTDGAQQPDLTSSNASLALRGMDLTNEERETSLSVSTDKIETLPVGSLLYQQKTSGRLIVTRNDKQEIAFIHLTIDWYYAPPKWHWRGGRTMEFRVSKPLPESRWDLVRVA